MSELARHLINGEWVNSSNYEFVAVNNTGTGEVIGEYASGTEADVELAVAAAKSAFKSTEWANSPRVRAAVLLEFADRMEKVQDELAQQMSRENGKLVGESRHEVSVTISELRYYAGLARNIFGRVMEIEPSLYALLSSEPLGVSVIIVPWNAPITLLVRSLAPALAAGCTVVIKPAEQTSIINSKVIELTDGITGLPDGVINVVNGGVEVSKALVASRDVDVISYTGSTGVGKMIMEAGASTLKRMNLELGGSAPCIVMPDADMQKTVPAIVRAACAHAGQVCMSASRIFVHTSKIDEFQSAITEQFRSLRVGFVDDESSQMGPVIDSNNAERVLRIVDSSRSAGEILVQGEVLEGDFKTGNFLTPSLVNVTDPSSVMLHQEIFGPAISLNTFSEEEDVITRANNSRFGLCSSVWTQDLATGQRMAHKLETGTIWINQHMRTHAEIEAGGYKESGLGRLHGVEGLMEFMHSKHISWKLD